MSLARIDEKLKIVSVEAKDMRWPTSLGGHGSDAMVWLLIIFFHILFVFIESEIFSTLILITHVHMSLSKRTVRLKATDWPLQMVVAMKSYNALSEHSVWWLLVGTYATIFMDDSPNSGVNWPVTLNWDGWVLIWVKFGMNRFEELVDSLFWLIWKKIILCHQLGPEKGVIHLAVAAVINALWDLWAKLENKPLWRLLTDMEPEVRPNEPNSFQSLDTSKINIRNLFAAPGFNHRFPLH